MGCNKISPSCRPLGITICRPLLLAVLLLLADYCPVQVLEKVEVWESIARQAQGNRHRLYKVKFSFLPHHYYKVSQWDGANPPLK